MKSVKSGLLAIGLLSLGACAAPAISDIATDKVKVEAVIDDPKAVQAEAEHGCAIYNRVPVALSKRVIPTGGWTSRTEYLFACMDPSGANVTPRTARPAS
jgi:hypothetical protein